MVVSGRQLASAYWQGPDRLVPIPQDGFRNGDLARRDEDGYVYITGREKDIIITGGVNIASLELTNCLIQHPDVADAATLGVRADIYGEVPAGFVVLRPGQRATAAALLEHCRATLVPFKVPAAAGASARPETRRRKRQSPHPPADPRQHLRAERAFGEGLDLLDQRIARLDVHAGPSVGERWAGGVSRHRIESRRRAGYSAAVCV